MEIQWSLVFYTLLTSLGLGTFAFVAITEWLGKAERTRMPGAITALVAIALGGVAGLFHIGHLERFFNVLGHLTSGIAQEMILMGLMGLVILVYIVMVWRGSPAATRKIVANIGLVLAVVLGITLGTNYILPSRPAWNTFLLPLVFVASAAVLGLFSMYIWAAKEEDATVMGMNKAIRIALAVQATIVVGYVIFLAVAPNPDPSRSAARLLAGDISVVFWVGVVLIGLVVPLWLTAWFQTAKKVLPTLGLATVGLVCVLVGGIATRAIMYMLGSSIERFL